MLSFVVHNLLRPNLEIRSENSIVLFEIESYRLIILDETPIFFKGSLNRKICAQKLIHVTITLNF